MTGRRRLAAMVLPAALCCAAIVTTRAQQSPVFTARSDSVRLDILVSASGRPILGLGADDFHITDNGVPQKPDFVSFDQLPLNVVMAFDTSASMLGQRLDDLRAAGHGVLNQLRQDDRAALVSFSQTLLLGSDLTTDLRQVGAAINRGEATGLTSLVDASFSGLVLTGVDSGRSVMFVFSDGVDTSSWLEPATVVNAAKRANVVVFGVTVGRSRAPFLKDLTEVTGGDLVQGPVHEGPAGHVCAIVE